MIKFKIISACYIENGDSIEKKGEIIWIIIMVYIGLMI